MVLTLSSGHPWLSQLKVSQLCLLLCGTWVAIEMAGAWQTRAPELIWEVWKEWGRMREPLSLERMKVIAIDLSTVLLLLALFGTLLGKTESMLELVRSSEDRYQARYK